MGFNIESIKANIRNGARAYNWMVFLPEMGELATYAARTAALPSRSIGEIEVPWQNGTFYLGGKATYDTLNIDFIIDEEHKVLDKLQKWMDKLYDPTNGQSKPPSEYKTNIEMHLLDGEGNAKSKYTLVGAWPQNIGELQLDYSNEGIITCSVTFRFDYYKKR